MPLSTFDTTSLICDESSLSASKGTTALSPILSSVPATVVPSALVVAAVVGAGSVSSSPPPHPAVVAATRVAAAVSVTSLAMRMKSLSRIDGQQPTRRSAK